MKSLRVSLVLMMVISMFSCKKYEDGPCFSLRSRNERLINTWRIDKVYENGADKTTDYQNAFVNYKLILASNHEYTLTYRPFNLTNYTETGDWIMSSNETAVSFSVKSGGTSGSPSQWKLLRLKEKEVWATQKDRNGKEIELHLKED